MKYAEGPTVEVETVVAADPAVVWALISDIHTPVRFSQELLEVRWITGTQFVGRSCHSAIGEWETTCTVVASVPEQTFSWVVGEPDHPSAQWRFTMEPGDVGVRLHQWMRMGPAPSGLTPAILSMPDKEERIIARRLDEHRHNMEATVQGIKQLAEQA
jgi:hypothetical protein